MRGPGRGRWCGFWLAVVVVGCGDNLSEPPSFELIGHHDLGGRGMNAALAVAGDFVYVGSRIDQRPIEILDIADPTHPVAVGEIPGTIGMSSRELRAIDDTLVVLSLRCSSDLHGCAPSTSETEAIELYDIHDRAAPVRVGTYPVASAPLRRRSPHEMYLRRDIDRTLLYIAEPPSTLEVLDITDPANPTSVVEWNPMIPSQGFDDILHSVSVSRDGHRAFLSHQLSGILVADTRALPEMSLITPATAPLDFSPPSSIGPHSAVEVPGRDLLVVTEEVYPPPYGTGCPWGKARIVDIALPATPIVVGEVGVAENDPALCATGSFDRVTFTAHNTTATHDLAFVTWHAAGLEAIDVSDPTAPQIVAEFRPEPLRTVATEDPGLGGNPVEMWSYPVIRDGLIYVVDVRNGLYVLRYHGPFAGEVTSESFLEGNSNL